MQELNPEYIDQLEVLAGEIQESDELARYLEEEEEEDFNRLKEMFEPRIALLYAEVAHETPLQLIALEKAMLLDEFEGLFLPKILGYSVLRGVVNQRMKYQRPQDHFKEILLAICNSANFDILKKRIGQSIQIGFALSSDIWITNLINQIDNKRIRYYLQSQKLDNYRVEKDRRIGYQRYKRQFLSDNFQTAEFPESLGELKVMFNSLLNFLVYRIQLKNADNSSLIQPLRSFLSNESFMETTEYLKILFLYANFFELEKEAQAELLTILNKARNKHKEFDLHWLEFLLHCHHTEPDVTPEADQRVSVLIDRKIKSDLSAYYDLTDTIHQQGYNTEKAQEAVRLFYNNHQGLSVVNECVRQTIYKYFARFINNLEPADYPEFFEISKLFTIYIQIFANQKFNQEIKELCMRFVRRCLKTYTDKRGKDYQDIKKFVSTTFQDLGFLKEKEVVELFKTRRKRKKPTS
jgi:hypothetical protein